MHIGEKGSGRHAVIASVCIITVMKGLRDLGYHHTLIHNLAVVEEEKDAVPLFNPRTLRTSHELASMHRNSQKPYHAAKQAVP